MHLVDTSVWIEFLRRQGSVRIQGELKPLIRSGAVAITEWVILELMSGLRSSENASNLLDRLTPIHRLSLPVDGWPMAWDLAARLRKKGVSASAADCLIATVASAHDATLIHCDTDFEFIAAHSRLRTMNWVGLLQNPDAGKPRRRGAS